MTKVALRGLAQRKLRAVVTVLAILLGVAFIAGSYVLTDTINRSFDDIFDEAYAGTDVAISLEHHGPGRQRRPAAVLGALPRPGARRARRGAGGRGGIFSLGRFVDEEGDPLSNSFAPEFISSTLARAVPDAHLHRGPAPRDRRRGLDRRVHRRSRGPRHRRHAADRRPGRGQGGYRIVGLQRLGNTSGGGSSTAQLTLPEAQRITDKLGELDGISVKAAPGVSPRELRQRIDRVLPPRLRRGDRQPGRRPPGAGHQGRPLSSSASCCSCSAAWRCWWAAS